MAGKQQSAEDFLAGVGPQAPAAAGAPAQDPSAVSRYAKLGLNALVGGVNQLVGTPGNIEQLLDTGAGTVGNWLTGANIQMPEAPLTSGRIGRFTNALGLTNRPEALPTTAAERYGTVGAEGAIGGLSGGLPGIIAGASGGLAGQATHEALPDSKWAPFIAGTVTGLGVGGATGLAKNYLTGRALASNVASSEQALLDAKNTAAAASENKFQNAPKITEQTQNVIDASKKNLAATKQALQESLQLSHAEADQKIGQLASSIGSSKTLQDAGEWLQASARNWKSEVMPQKMAELRAPVEAAIPQNAPVQLTTYESLLKDINKRGGDLQQSVNALTNSGPRQLAAALNARKDTLAQLDAAPGVEVPSPPTSWQNARQLRTVLGDAMSNPKIVQDIGAQNLDKLYAGISADLRSTAIAHGAGDAWDAYNAGSTQLYKFASGPLSKIISTDNPLAESIVPEKAASAALSGGARGGSDLAALREQIPEGMNELAAAHLQNPTAWSKLSPEAKTALLPQPEHVSTMDSLLAGKDAAKQEFGAAVSAADAAHKQIVAAAQKAAASGKFADREQLRSASQAVQAAMEQRRAAAEALASHQAQQSMMQNDLTHRLMGGAAGALGMEHLLHGNPLLGAAAGYVLPAVTAGIRRGASGALRPDTMMLPAIGGASGGLLPGFGTSPSSDQR